QHTKVRGPFQPHVVLNSTPMLQALIVILLDILDSAPIFGIHSNTTGSPITVIATILVQGPGVVFRAPSSTLVPSFEPSRFASHMVLPVQPYVLPSRRFDRIRKLVKGFASYLQEETTSLVLSGGIVQSIIDHARMIESIWHARQGNCTKRFLRQGAHKVIRVGQCKPLFSVQMVLGDPGLFRPIKGSGPVVLFLRSLGTMKRISPDELFLLSNLDHRLLVLH
ncbi:hypothetical protein H5410_031303, partial [Solanum commersonii]